MGATPGGGHSNYSFRQTLLSVDIIHINHRRTCGATHRQLAVRLPIASENNCSNIRQKGGSQQTSWKVRQDGVEMAEDLHSHTLADGIIF